MTFESDHYTVAEDVLFQPRDDDVVLLHLGTSRYYGLDEVGARFWTLLVEDGHPERAIPLLLAEFDVDEQTLRTDLQRLLYELTEATLLRTSP